MIEGIILIIIFIISALSSFLVLFFLAIGLFRKSRTLFKTGLFIAIIPVSLWTLVYWYYDIHIPYLNRKEEIKYSGSYILIHTPDSNMMQIQYGNTVRLELNTDHTFYLDKNEFSTFYGLGKWKAGATDDGQFEFRDQSNSIIFWATPSNDNKLELDRSNMNSNRIIFTK